METLECISCFEDKPVTEFKRTKGNSRSAKCNACSPNLGKANPLQTKDKQAMQRYWAYKLTPADYQKLLDDQNSVCAICEQKNELVIDHDHKCCSGNSSTCGNCVRGLLCFDCNILVGFLEKRKNLLPNAMNYIAERAL